MVLHSAVPTLRDRRFCFIFSSRRRHTRWPRDWSSDVCSSDLSAHLLRVLTLMVADKVENPGAVGLLCAVRHVPRSEERRVGKGCRARWWAKEIGKMRKYDTR